MWSKGDDGGWLGKADRAESTECALSRIELGNVFVNVDGVQMVELKWVQCAHGRWWNVRMVECAHGRMYNDGM